MLANIVVFISAMTIANSISIGLTGEPYTQQDSLFGQISIILLFIGCLTLDLCSLTERRK